MWWRSNINPFHVHHVTITNDRTGAQTIEQIGQNMLVFILGFKAIG